MLGHEPVEIRDELLMPAEPQPGLAPPLDALEPELLQPQRLGSSEELAAELAENIASPQGESACEDGVREPVVPAGERSATVGEQMLEALGVELPFLDEQAIAGPFGDETAGREHPPKLGDVQPESARRRRRSSVVPDRLDQDVHGERLACPERQRREKPLRLRDELYGLAVDERLERPQDPKLEATVGLAAAAIHGLGAFTVDHRLLLGLHRATPLGRAGPTNPMRGSADLGESILGDRSGDRDFAAVSELRNGGTVRVGRISPSTRARRPGRCHALRGR